jgi:hypothetical protein
MPEAFGNGYEDSMGVPAFEQATSSEFQYPEADLSTDTRSGDSTGFQDSTTLQETSMTTMTATLPPGLRRQPSSFNFDDVIQTEAGPSTFSGKPSDLLKFDTADQDQDSPIIFTQSFAQAGNRTPPRAGPVYQDTVLETPEAARNDTALPSPLSDVDTQRQKIAKEERKDKGPEKQDKEVREPCDCGDAGNREHDDFSGNSTDCAHLQRTKWYSAICASDGFIQCAMGKLQPILRDAYQLLFYRYEKAAEIPEELEKFYWYI